MKVRVIEKQEEGLDWKDKSRIVTHYIPQYFDEVKGWRECYLDSNLVARYYYKLEDAINVCRSFVDKHAKVVWSEDIYGEK